MEDFECAKTEQALYRIGMFSKMNRVTVKALRYYDEIGLLKPAFIDKYTGYRYYSSAQLPMLHQILALKDMGFTMDEISQVQKGMSEKELLQHKKTELMRQMAEITLKLSQVESYLTDKEADKDYHIIMRDVPECIVACREMVLPNYGALFQQMPEMGAEMEQLGCVCAAPEYCYTAYLDGEYKEENVHVEICEAVTEQKENTSTLTFKVIPAVPQMVCVLHKGPYSTLAKAYAAAMRFAKKNGFEIYDNPRESYIDGIWNKDSEEEWLTEIQFPVQKYVPEE